MWHVLTVRDQTSKKDTEVAGIPREVVIMLTTLFSCCSHWVEHSHTAAEKYSITPGRAQDYEGTFLDMGEFVSKVVIWVQS